MFRADGTGGKCLFDENKSLVPCSPLEAMLEEYNPGQKGLAMVGTARIDEPGIWRSRAVVVKSGKHKREGVIANYCPFCGTNIAENLRNDW